MRLLSITFFLLLCTAGRPDWREAEPRAKGQNYAVFFYVSTFQDRGWPRLPETKSEAEAIARELQTNYGFTIDLVANPTRQQIRDKIAEWNERVRPDDQILFFFSTHGYYDERGDEGFLIPAEGKLNDTYGDTWLSYAELGRRITLSRSRHVLLALDACYSGAFGIRNKGRPESAPWENQTGLDCEEQVRLALARPSRLYFCSGGKTQRTPARSLFARRWLEALRKGEELGVVRSRDLRYFLGRIENPAPEDGSFTGHDDGDFILVHKNACSSAQASRAGGPRPTDAAHWSQTQSNPSRELLLEHLGQFPGCAHEAEAISLLRGEPKDLPRDMVLVRGGEFQMGSKDGENDEKPVHKVRLSDFYMGQYEVTVEAFSRFIQATGYRTDADKDGGSYIWNGSEWEKKAGVNWKYDAQGNLRSSSEYNHPVIHVSWNDAVAYCNWLSKEHRLQPVYTVSGSTVTADWNANGYRLPTEAEWEYAARSRGGNDQWAGTSSEGSLSIYGNYWENGANDKDSYEYTAPVGSFQPNGLGLYDMSGNVWEWCWDWYGSDYYGKSSGVNPTGPGEGSYRVLRGGSWFDDPAHLRCANRDYYSPANRNDDIGFRLSRAAR